MSTLPADQRYESPARRGLDPWLVRLPILFFTGAILTLTALTIFAGVAQLAYRDRILAGVSSYGLDLSGMTINEAMSALNGRFTYDDSAVFTFRDADQFWQMSAGELGVSFDPQATATEAFAVGHSGNPLLNVVDQFLIWLNGQRITPIIRYDQNVATERLMAIASDLNRPPVDATLSINGTTVSSTPSSIGRMVNIPATLEQLEANVLGLTTGAEVSLIIEETAPRIRDAEAAAIKARNALSSPLLLVAEGTSAEGTALGPWTATVEQIASLLQVGLVENVDGTFNYDVSFNPSAYRDYLDTLAAGLFQPAQNARFHFVDETGQLQVIQPSVSERRLDVASTLSRMEDQVFNPGNRIVPVAFDYRPAQYHDDMTAAELGIVGLISEGDSYYTGSSRPRIENILQATARFDGIIIGAGETFSFNQWVGDISPEEGYVSGRVIYGGRTIDGVGGGVCQVSTTAFRAAFYGGFPILERAAHGYRVGYYELGGFGPGLDAAIYTPDLDFQFLNDTGAPILIEASVFPATNMVQFRIYGADTGRQVVKDGPMIRDVVPPAPTHYEPNADLQPGQQLQVDIAAEGSYVQVTRIILDSFGNEVGRDIFASQYQPWGAIIQVPPGDPRLQTG
ncbi:MAG: VanW family protein [Anaerolineae bacterium]|nr:VanW family protein [Anaerolineae bacterium]